MQDRFDGLSNHWSMICRCPMSPDLLNHHSRSNAHGHELLEEQLTGIRHAQLWDLKKKKNKKNYLFCWFNLRNMLLNLQLCSTVAARMKFLWKNLLTLITFNILDALVIFFEHKNVSLGINGNPGHCNHRNCLITIIFITKHLSTGNCPLKESILWN